MRPSDGEPAIPGSTEVKRGRIQAQVRGTDPHRFLSSVYVQSSLMPKRGSIVIQAGSDIGLLLSFRAGRSDFPGLASGIPTLGDVRLRIG